VVYRGVQHRTRVESRPTPLPSRHHNNPKLAALVRHGRLEAAVVNRQDHTIVQARPVAVVTWHLHHTIQHRPAVLDHLHIHHLVQVIHHLVRIIRLRHHRTRPRVQAIHQRARAILQHHHLTHRRVQVTRLLRQVIHLQVQAIRQRRHRTRLRVPATRQQVQVIHQHHRHTRLRVQVIHQRRPHTRQHLHRTHQRVQIMRRRHPRIHQHRPLIYQRVHRIRPRAPLIRPLHPNTRHRVQLIRRLRQNTYNHLATRQLHLATHPRLQLSMRRRVVRPQVVGHHNAQQHRLTIHRRHLNTRPHHHNTRRLVPHIRLARLSILQVHLAILLQLLIRLESIHKKTTTTMRAINEKEMFASLFLELLFYLKKKTL